MTKIRLLCDLEYDEELMHGDDEKSKRWFFETVLFDEPLLLHSNEIGDTVGEITVHEIGPIIKL